MCARNAQKMQRGAKAMKEKRAEISSDSTYAFAYTSLCAVESFRRSLFKRHVYIPISAHIAYQVANFLYTCVICIHILYIRQLRSKQFHSNIDSITAFLL